MKSALFYLFIIFFNIISFASAEIFKVDLDIKDIVSTVPRNFRIIHEQISLRPLNISASGQFSAHQLNFLKNLALKNNKKLLIIDLRAEDHGFINGLPVRWYPISYAVDSKIQTFNPTINQTIHYKDSPEGTKISLKSFITEAALLKNHGIKYYNIKVRNLFTPDKDQVREIVDVINENLDNYWIHIHCKAGRGRTTTALMVHFINEYSGIISLKDLINYQNKIGGINLSIEAAEKKQFIFKELVIERARFIEDLYRELEEIEYENDNKY